MKIAIAGGTGLLGRTIANYDKNSSNEFIILTRKKEKDYPSLQKKFDNKVSLVTWNPLEIGDWVSALEGVEVIINLVGESLASGLRWTKKVKKKLVDSRVVPSKALVEAISQLSAKPKFFIQISGANYYPFSKQPITDEADPADTFLGNLCVDWERPIQESSFTGMNKIILRLSPVIAKESLLMKLLLLPYKLFAGGRYGLKGDQYFSWVHKNDFAKFIFYSLDENLNGNFILSSPQPIQNKDMNRIIGKTLKRPWFLPVPSFILKIVLGEKSDLLLKSVNVVPERINQTSFEFSFQDFEQALNDLFKKSSD